MNREQQMLKLLMATLALAVVLCMVVWMFAGWALMFGLLYQVMGWPWWAAVPISVSVWWLGVCVISYVMEF